MTDPIVNDARPIVELTGVAKRYDAIAGAAAPWVLDAIDLSVIGGQTLAIRGPSGSGKSTLLNIIGALDRPSAGRVLIDGADLAPLTDNQLATLRNRAIGFVFQSHHLLPQCTAIENVLVPTLANRDKSRRRSAAGRAVQLLGRVGLADHLHHRPGELSVGQCQRVAVVRALINEPKLLLADEPTGSLDRVAADGLVDLLVELNRTDRVTLIVATHGQQIAARMDRVVQLRDAHLVEGGAEP